MKDLKENIILLGMTGVGKTTIGKLLSKELKRKFIDIDQEIEKISNLKIKDFFLSYGENEFRKLEKNVLLKYLKKDNYVLAPGAGILVDNEVKKTLVRDCLCVFLDIDINFLIPRIRKNLSNRPKLSKGELEDNLKQMYTERINDYKKSHITINVNELSITNAVYKIIKALEKYGDQNSQL